MKKDYLTCHTQDSVLSKKQINNKIFLWLKKKRENKCNVAKYWLNLLNLGDRYMHAYMLSHFSSVWLFATLWNVARQAPLSMGFSWREYWSGCHALLQGIFLTQWSNPHLLCILHWQAGSLPLVPRGSPIGIWGTISMPRECVWYFERERNSFYLIRLAPSHSLTALSLSRQLLTVAMLTTLLFTFIFIFFIYCLLILH